LWDAKPKKKWKFVKDSKHDQWSLS